jgi:hypothetical protein
LGGAAPNHPISRVAQTGLCSSLQGIVNSTLCVAGLKLLFIAAKAVSDSIQRHYPEIQWEF